MWRPAERRLKSISIFSSLWGWAVVGKSYESQDAQDTAERGSSTKTSFPELVKMMVEHDMRFVKKLYLKAQVVEWLLVYLKIGKFFCKKMEAMGKMKSYKEQNENKQVVGAIKYVQIAREERTDDFQ